MLTAIILTACILSGLGSLIALAAVLSYRGYSRGVDAAEDMETSFHVGAR